MAFRVLACMALLVISSAKEQSRWSRQISSYTADISDWVPLSGPVESEPVIPLKRQAVAEPRILSEPFPEITRQLGGYNSDPFSQRTYYNSLPSRQLYLQSIPSAPQNYLTDQGFGQGLRFGLSQPNFPLTQGFISPQYNFDSVSDFKAKPQANTNPIKFNNFPQTIPQFPAPNKSFLNPPIQSPKQIPDLPKFVDGYRVDNNTDLNKRKSQSHQKIRFDNYDKSKEVINPPKPKIEREEVQLLYVPLESLNRGQFNFRNPIASPETLNRELYSQTSKQNPLMQNLAAEIQRPKTVDTYKSQDLSNLYNSQSSEIGTTMYSTLTLPFTTTAATTPKPKLKPHQPPLAIFLTQEAKKGNDIKVSDVLSSLKNARTVPVLDSVNPVNAPEVFIGPSALNSPEGFVKFELPYLSNIENKDKKLKQLPFFVAPLSYNTPNGFAKIPFPSPHVGSVVINSQIQDSSSTAKAPPVANVLPNAYTESFGYNVHPPVTQKPKISYYSTSAPKENMLHKHKQNYYSFEPQTVSSITPNQQANQQVPNPVLGGHKTGSYFISNENQFSPSQYINFPQDNTYHNSAPNKLYNNYVQDMTSTTKSSTTVTTKPPSTYSTRLLETHNPYSINQGLQFNVPNNFHGLIDEFKETHVTQGYNPLQTPQTPASLPNADEVKYEQTQSPNRETPSYQQNYKAETYYNKQSNQHINYQVPNINELSVKMVSQTPSPDRVPQTYQQNYYDGTYKQSSEDFNSQISNVSELPVKTETQTQSSSNRVTPAYQQNYQAEEYYNEQNNQDLSNKVPNISELSAKTVPNSNSDKISPSESIDVNYNSGYEPVLSKSQFNDNSVTSTQSSLLESSEIPNNLQETQLTGIQSSDSSEFNRYNVNYSSQDIQPSTTTSSSTTTKTTTTKRTPIRSRGRPKYTTVKQDTNEYSTRPTITRRPIRERRPPTNRPRYEPNKIVSEKTTKQSFDSSESTTRSYKYRTRGKVHYKPSEGEEIYEKQIKADGKMTDLAYQRDILHQNYPVTLMERASTVDIEAITEPIEKSSSLENFEPTKAEDTINAYSNDELSITKHSQTTENEQFTSVEQSNIKDVLLANTQYEDNDNEIKTTAIPTIISSDESSEEVYASQTTPKLTQNSQGPFEIKQREPASDDKYSKENEQQEIEQNYNESREEEASVGYSVETTPSYNRVRIRPGVIRQHHHTSTTESSKTKNDRRNNAPITYRPAFDRRRTTMRIEEIEADLKTKQVHTRAEFKDYRQPIYKPDPTTESTPSSTQITTKRSQLRRKRPTYTTTSTEGSINRRPYEVKNRLRVRRPTDKPTDKPETEIDESTTTAKSIQKYSHRPKLSQRFNKKPEAVTSIEDQDSNGSIHRPKYASPDPQRWSPKLSGGSFKPFNPNDITDQPKEETNGGPYDDDLEIITVGQEDILISVTPATNNRVDKKVPDIPPTLEAFVEQTKVTKSEPSDTMSTFETMLEEVMKTLEEQDEDEYTNKVMKHKGGEIGEIPPERVISSGVNYSSKSTTPLQEEITTTRPSSETSSPNEEEQKRQKQRRGYWKKVKVRPVAEGIEAAESQYYTKTVNRLGQHVPSNAIDKSVDDKSKFTVTTYKPPYKIVKNLLESEDESLDVIADVDIPKLNSKNESYTHHKHETLKELETSSTESYLSKETPTEKANPGEMDLGTGSPDPTYDDSSYYSDPTEPTSTSKKHDRSDRFSIMDYLFGMKSSEESEENDSNRKVPQKLSGEVSNYYKTLETDAETKKTTETTYIPEEFTEDGQIQTVEVDTEQVPYTNYNINETNYKIETTSQSSFMDPKKVISTSMSTEISHETEICFRGKCIKTIKNLK